MLSTISGIMIPNDELVFRMLKNLKKPPPR